MINGGFLTQNRTSPLGLGLVVAGHAAVLTALALAPPEAIQGITFLPTIVKTIADPPPPPKAPPPPRKFERPTTPAPLDRVVDVGQHTSPIEFRPLPPVDLTQPIQPPPLQAEPKFVAASIDPGAASRFQPGYPSALARAEIEGSVTVRVLIGADGRVKVVELVSTAHPGFFDATKEQALRAWRFRPATRDGVVTESWRTMTVHFRLES